ncbi:hypothetical protein Pint_20424 [Pistacia integerrima]|uniref:Uncharacterized protein n=1 Tax=Pistacia integerrima TaxID=434235 RepID=A0ACC0XB73_9ROSI|nr:hypothetical protein Pint_20424 [Pistacia integerrima]
MNVLMISRVWVVKQLPKQIIWLKLIN